MYIPRKKKQTYNVAEGGYTSKVVAMYGVQGKGKCDAAVKIVFAPIKLEQRSEQSVVASEYCVDSSNERLIADLNTILDGAFEEHMDEFGNFDEKAVNERRVDIVVSSFHNGEHDRPYTFVTAILPPETLGLG